MLRNLARPLLFNSSRALRCWHQPKLAEKGLLATWPRRCSSTAPADDAKPEKTPQQPTVVFEGAKNKIVGTLKMASVANLGFALASAPLLQYITSAMGTPGKGTAMSALLITFGGGTTGALAWATTTYVYQITTIPGKEALLIDTPTLMGGTKSTEVAWTEITRPMGWHPFATFEAAGNKYYLDELGTMHDDGFMERCAPRTATASAPPHITSWIACHTGLLHETALRRCLRAVPRLEKAINA
jgi:hypothetical protein